MDNKNEENLRNNLNLKPLKRCQMCFGPSSENSLCKKCYNLIRIIPPIQCEIVYLGIPKKSINDSKCKLKKKTEKKLIKNNSKCKLKKKTEKKFTKNDSKLKKKTEKKFTKNDSKFKKKTKKKLTIYDNKCKLKKKTEEKLTINDSKLDLKIKTKRKLPINDNKCQSSSKKKTEENLFIREETQLVKERAILDKHFYQYGVKTEDIVKYCKKITPEKFILDINSKLTELKEYGQNTDKLTKAFYVDKNEISSYECIDLFQEHLNDSLREAFLDKYFYKYGVKKKDISKYCEKITKDKFILNLKSILMELKQYDQNTDKIRNKFYILNKGVPSFECIGLFQKYLNERLEEAFLDKYFYKYRVKKEDIQKHCEQMTLDKFILEMKSILIELKDYRYNTDELTKLFYCENKGMSSFECIAHFQKYLKDHLQEAFLYKYFYQLGVKEEHILKYCKKMSVDEFVSDLKSKMKKLKNKRCNIDKLIELFYMPLEIQPSKRISLFSERLNDYLKYYQECSRKCFVKLDKHDIDNYEKGKKGAPEKALLDNNADEKEPQEVLTDEGSRKKMRKSDDNLHVKYGSDSSDSDSIINQNKQIRVLADNNENRVEKKTSEKFTNDCYSKIVFHSDCQNFENIEIHKNDEKSTKMSKPLPKEDEKNWRKTDHSRKCNSDVILTSSASVMECLRDLREKVNDSPDIPTTKKTIGNKRSPINLNDENSKKKRKLKNIDEDYTSDYKSKEKEQNVKSMEFVSEDTEIDKNEDVTAIEDPLLNIDFFVSDSGDDGTRSDFQTNTLQNENEAREIEEGNGLPNTLVSNDDSPVAFVDQDLFKKDKAESKIFNTNLYKNKDHESFTSTFDNRFDENKQKKRQPEYSDTKFRKENNTTQKFVEFNFNSSDNEKLTCISKERSLEIKKANVTELLDDVYSAFQKNDENILLKKSDKKISNAIIQGETVISEIKPDSGLTTKPLKDNHGDSKSESDKQLFKVPDSRITNLLKNKNQARVKKHSETETSNSEITNSPRGNMESTFPIEKEQCGAPDDQVSDVVTNNKLIVESDHCYRKIDHSQLISTSETHNVDKTSLSEKEHSKTQDVRKSDVVINQKLLCKETHSKCETNNLELFPDYFKSKIDPSLIFLSSLQTESDPEKRKLCNEYRMEVREKCKRKKKDLLINDEDDTEMLNEQTRSCNLSMPSISLRKNLPAKGTKDPTTSRKTPEIIYQQNYANKQDANSKSTADTETTSVQDGEPDLIDSSLIAETLEKFNLMENSNEDRSSPTLDPRSAKYDLYCDDDWGDWFMIFSDGVTPDTEYKPVFSKPIILKDLWEGIKANRVPRNS